jgi:hypothetical protein
VTEAQWLACIDVDLLQSYLRRQGVVSDRKFRLFGCACARRVAPLLTDPRNQQAIDVAERYADGVSSKDELNAAKAAAWVGVTDARKLLNQANSQNIAALTGSWLASSATVHVVTSHPAWKAALNASDSAAEAVAMLAAEGGASIDLQVTPDEAERWNGVRKASRTAEEREQAAVLRHIIGNPFAPALSPVHLPANILQLASALYEGQDCAFALHDALHDAGVSDLASHFQKSAQRHPKGCWALDLLLDNH